MATDGVYSQSEDGTQAVALVEHLSEVAPRDMAWLWPGRVPLGKVTLLVGDPGRGKSLLALDIAARVSRGAPWPEASGAAAPLGRTILLSAEDDVGDTIRPRLEALGGDPERVSILRAVHWEDALSPDVFSLSRDLALFEAVVRKWRDTRLVVLDPLSAYLCGAGSHSNVSLRRALAGIKLIAERSGVAVLAITHLTKQAGASVLYRAIGSLAPVAAARAVWAALPDPAAQGGPQAAGRMLLLPVKCNLAGAVAGIAYRILPHPANPALPTVVWEPEPVAMGAQDAIDAMSKLSPRDRAAGWLLGRLAGGPALAAAIEAEGRRLGLTPMTLRRAKTELGVTSSKVGAAWVWRLPEHAAPDGPPAPCDATEPAGQQ